MLAGGSLRSRKDRLLLRPRGPGDTDPKQRESAEAEAKERIDSRAPLEKERRVSIAPMRWFAETCPFSKRSRDLKMAIAVRVHLDRTSQSQSLLVSAQPGEEDCATAGPPRGLSGFSREALRHLHPTAFSYHLLSLVLKKCLDDW